MTGESITAGETAHTVAQDFKSIIMRKGAKMYKWINLSSEAQDAAKWCAERGYNGEIGDKLPENLSTMANIEINNKQLIFRMAINIFKGFKYMGGENE